MFKRSQYLNSECTHNEYYSQYVTKNHIMRTKGLILKGVNQTPLKVWDRMHLGGVNASLTQLGEENTLSFKVCVLKQACRMAEDEVIETYSV